MIPFGDHTSVTIDYSCHPLTRLGCVEWDRFVVSQKNNDLVTSKYLHEWHIHETMCIVCHNAFKE
jgi:hypothetical protein